MPLIIYNESSMKHVRKVLIILLFLLFIMPLCSCSYEEKEDNDTIKIGMVVGSIFDQYIPSLYPNSEIVYFYSASDLPLALETEKIDIYIDDEYSAREQCKEYTNHKIDRIIFSDHYGFIFNKNKENLRKQMNDYLEEIRQDGRLKEFEDIWLNSDDETIKDIDYSELTGENGVLNVGVAATMPPVNYIKDGKYVGYEEAIIEGFAKEYGYNLNFKNSDFSSTMTSTTAGTVDIGAASFSISEERKKNMLFSDPHMSANCVAVIKDGNKIFTQIKEEKKQRIGVVTGALFDIAVKNDNPNAQIEYYSFTHDLPIALENNKIDGYTVDEPVARMLCNRYEGHYIVKQLTYEKYGIIFDKDKPELQNEFNEYLAKITDSGELYELQETWLGLDENKKVIDFDSIANNSKVLKLATTSGMQPFDYNQDNHYAGYEIALVASFCKEYGYGLQIEDSNFAGVLAAVSTGKADLGSCVITITDERKQTMNFSKPIYEGGIVLVKKRNDAQFLETLAGKKIGVQAGTTYDDYVIEMIDDVKVEYYNLVSDLKAALDSNKIDGFVLDSPVADLFVNENNGKYKVLGSLHDVDYGIAVSKVNEDNKQLITQLDNFMSKLLQNGSLNEIYNNWISDDESKKIINFDSLNSNGKEITVALSTITGAPFVYEENRNIYGFEVDLIYRFCKEYGYSLKIDNYDFSGLFSAISTSKCNFGVAGISITDERKESMDFVDEKIKGGCVVVVKNDDNDIEPGIFERLYDSFYNTFIREDRWKLFVSGIGTTILITALSIIIGTILGFVFYFMYLNLGTVGKKIIDLIRNIILKTPTVVLLMIIYYIIFSKSDLRGSVISIVGLSILFANSVTGLLMMGTNSIGKGQIEAALALGYSKNKAFIEIILPQVILIVLSGYKSSIVTLIKDSAIVGYIAVQDLTKVGDIIRSRTYEAFFPLIATAIIYYAIATLFIYIVNKTELIVDPKKRKNIRILKGVKTNDRN